MKDEGLIETRPGDDDPGRGRAVAQARARLAAALARDGGTRPATPARHRGLMTVASRVDLHDHPARAPRHDRHHGRRPARDARRACTSPSAAAPKPSSWPSD